MDEDNQGMIQSLQLMPLVCSCSSQETCVSLGNNNSNGTDCDF